MYSVRGTSVVRSDSFRLTDYSSWATFLVLLLPAVKNEGNYEVPP